MSGITDRATEEVQSGVDLVNGLTNSLRPYKHLVEDRQAELAKLVYAIVGAAKKAVLGAQEHKGDDAFITHAAEELGATIMQIQSVTYVLGRIDERRAQTEELVREYENGDKGVAKQGAK